LLKDLKVELDNNAGSSPEEKILSVKENMLDQLCLVSVHKGVSMPSMLIDSTGTKKIVALASFIIEALEKGRVLVVDELDSSLHFKLSRAIVALFNNELNINGQLIFTAHDISLMDCKKLFRKEQIWFIYKNQDNVYVYSLKDFTAREHGVRDTSDIIELYKKGVFGALPEPDLIENLLEVRQ
jgi:AAA15 family ATPase/GTPase